MGSRRESERGKEKGNREMLRGAASLKHPRRGEVAATTRRIRMTRASRQSGPKRRRKRS